MSFQNKVVWLTGASSGIGKAAALELSKQGTNVIISSRNTEKLEAVKAASAYPDKVKILELDLSNYSNFDSLVAEAISLFGKIDILINNGGVSQRSFVIDTSLDVDEQLMKTNYLGTVALTKALLPYFIERKAGQIASVTSVVGKIGTPLRSSYAASKHALHGFFDSLRAEVHKDNISVTLICPGYVKTNVSINALTGDGSKQNTMDKKTENGMTPENFAIKMLKAIDSKKQEVVIGGALEKLSVYMKRFLPKVLAKMIRKLAVI